MIDFFLEPAKYLQMVMGFPTIIMVCWVIWEWRYSIANFYKFHQSSAKWFSLGVFIHFSFALVDYLYWNLAWSVEYAGGEFVEWFEAGAVPNVLFRLLGTSLAAYCHIRSAREYRGESTVNMNCTVAFIYLTGFIYEYLIRAYG